MRDDLLVPEIVRLHAENYGVYGRRKMHALMRRQGWAIGRDQVERLMREAGVRGVRKSKKLFTTKSDPALQRPKDLVNRRLTADGPRRLWVCDVTYVATWSGFAYVAFVTDVYSRRIVGWNVAETLRAEILPLQALDISQVQGFIEPSRLKQKIKYRAGLYTPVARAIRQTAKGRFRTPFGLWPRTADGLADFNAVRIQRLFERVFSISRVPPWCRLETVDQPLQ